MKAFFVAMGLLVIIYVVLVIARLVVERLPWA
jgi:hypothetical protein